MTIYYKDSDIVGVRVSIESTQVSATMSVVITYMGGAKFKVFECFVVKPIELHMNGTNNNEAQEKYDSKFSSDYDKCQKIADQIAKEQNLTSVDKEAKF